MGDYANAVIKFKVSSKFETAFRDVFALKETDDNWYELFNNISYDGKLFKCDEWGYLVDENDDYVSDIAGILSLGRICNLAGNFSEDVISSKNDEDYIGNQEMSEDGIVTLLACKKWYTVDSMLDCVKLLIDDIADEVYVCEIVAPGEEAFYKVKYKATRTVEEWGYDFELTEVDREEITEDIV